MLACILVKIQIYEKTKNRAHNYNQEYQEDNTSVNHSLA